VFFPTRDDLAGREGHTLMTAFFSPAQVPTAFFCLLRHLRGRSACLAGAASSIRFPLRAGVLSQQRGPTLPLRRRSCDSQWPLSCTIVFFFSNPRSYAFQDHPDRHLSGLAYDVFFFLCPAGVASPPRFEESLPPRKYTVMLSWFNAMSGLSLQRPQFTNRPPLPPGTILPYGDGICWVLALGPHDYTFSVLDEFFFSCSRLPV